MANFIPNQISHIAASGRPDADNTSTDALANSATYTGSWSQAPVGSLLIVDLACDVNLDVQIQYSVDTTNTDSTLRRYYRTGLINAPYAFKNARPYYRVVVTNNSGGAASYMRLNTYVTDGEPLLNIPIDGTMSKDYSAISTRPTDYHYEVSLGRRQGHSTWNKFGYNTDVDVGTEIIASFGGTFTKMASADTLDVVSVSANDTSGGTGANSIIIYGVDENWDEQIEVVTMNGTTPVTTTGQWLGVNRVSIYLAGSSQSNAGNINITATTAATTQAQMPGGEGTTQQCIFFVPRNHQFLADWLHMNVNKISGGGSPTVEILGWVFSAVSNADYNVFQTVVDSSVENNVLLNPQQPFIVGEKSILYFEASTDTANTVVTLRFSGILVRDVDA